MCEHPSEEELERYSRGELGEARTVALEIHLLACERCINAIEAIEEHARLMRAGFQEL
jgi:anti-sigma factor ChrR (cupin superfamily)